MYTFIKYHLSVLGLTHLKLKRFWRWILRVWSWLAEGKVGVMCVLVIVAAILNGFVAWRSAKSIIYAGYALQLCGMLLAIRGLLLIRLHFRQPPLRNLFVNWLRRFPTWKSSVIEARGSGIISMNKSRLLWDISWAPDINSHPLEARIEAIVENVEQIRKELKNQYNYLEYLKDNFEYHKKSVAEENKNMERAIRSDLESLHTSDLIPSLVGLIWLLVGITMSTIPKELLDLLNFVNGLFV